MINLTTDERENVMRVMRAYDVPDQVIAESFGLTRQRVHRILGTRQADAHASTGKPARSKDLNTRLARELPAWRRRRGMSQSQAAEFLGIPYWQRVSAWESGKGCGMPGVLLRLLEALDKYEPPLK